MVGSSKAAGARKAKKKVDLSDQAAKWAFLKDLRPGAQIFVSEGGGCGNSSVWNSTSRQFKKGDRYLVLEVDPFSFKDIAFLFLQLSGKTINGTCCFRVRFTMLSPVFEGKHVVEVERVLKPQDMGKLAREKLRELGHRGEFLGDGSLRNTIVYSGCDPEVFLYREGKLVRSLEYLATSTQKGPGTRAYSEGLAAEFSTQPASCLIEEEGQIQYSLQKMLGAVNAKDPGVRLKLGSEAELSKEIVKAAGKDELALLCNPSKNVYGDRGEEIDEPRNFRFRFAGGHIHVGGGIRNMYAWKEYGPEALVKVLDSVLGVCSVCLAQGIESPRRRGYYGRAGEYRLPKWGLEYRVLSNYWLAHPTAFHLTFELARLATNLWKMGIWKAWKAEEDEVREIINYCDVKKATRVVEENAVVIAKLMKPLAHMKPTVKQVERTIEAILSGVRSFVRKPDMVAENWGVQLPGYAPVNYDRPRTWEDFLSGGRKRG